MKICFATAFKLMLLNNYNIIWTAPVFNYNLQYAKYS